MLLRACCLLAICCGPVVRAESFEYRTLITPNFGQPFSDAVTGGINNEGDVVGSYSLGFEYAIGGGFLIHDGHLSEINLFPYAVAPAAINNKGQMVGNYGVDCNCDIGFAAFLYQDKSFTYLSYPGASPYSTTVSGINDEGKIVGNYGQFTPGTKPGNFVFQNGVYTALPSLPGTKYTLYMSVNNAGVLVGNYGLTNGNVGSFAYQDGRFTNIPLPKQSDPYEGVDAINNRGDILGYDDQGPFLFKNGGYSFLNFPGASATFATGINDRDQIVGWYQSPATDYREQVFLATPVPEPSPFWLFALAASAFVVGSLRPTSRRPGSR